MSAISLKSITGITSITTPAGVDNQLTLHNNNTTEAVKLDTAGNLHFHNHLNITGISTAANFKTGTSNLHNTGLNVFDLDVDGHTNLDNVSIAGVTTMSGNLTVSGNVDASANGSRVSVGDNADLFMTHTNNGLIDCNTGNLDIVTQSSLLLKTANSENAITCNANGSVELYHNNVKKLETTVASVTLSDNLIMGNHHIELNDNSQIMFGNAPDLRMYHDGNHSYITNTTGDFTIVDESRIKFRTNQFVINNYANDENIIYAAADGEVSLYHNGSKKFDTTSAGVSVTGSVTSSSHLISDGNVIIGNSSPVAGKLEVNTGTEVNGATEYNGEDFAINIRANRGDSPNEEGNGICFSQRWYTGDNALIRTGAIVGYKISGNGSFGGGLKFKVQQSGGNPFRDIVRMRANMVEIPHDDVPLQFGAAGELRIRHTGSEHQIYGTNTDPFVFSNSGGERLRIDSNGQLLVGTTTSGANVRAVFQGYNGGGENFQARVQFQTAQATNLSTNHHLANLLFTNASSSIGAEIRVQADDNWGTNDYPTRISFMTTANGSGTRYDRMIIKNDGVVNIGVSSPQYAKKVNIQGDNDYTLSLSNQNYTGHAAGSLAGIEGRLQCGGGVWTSAGVRFVKHNGTSGDKHSRCELYATDGYASKIGLVVQPDGQVTKPLQPAFRATESANAQTGFITFDQVVTNVGNHYSSSNGRFTAPVAGTYFFTFYGMAGSNSGNLRVEYYINGSVHSSGEHWGGVAYAHGGTYSHISCSTILTLAANDYVNLNWNSSYNNLHSYHNGFMGYLIG